jgi:hypothetical protein
LLRISYRKHLEQQRIHDGEDGRIRPNAKREREHRNRGEPRAFVQLPERVSKVLK